MEPDNSQVPAPLCDFSEFNDNATTPSDSGVASQFYNDVSDNDLEELRLERDTLKRKREDLLRGREHAKLALDILHLRQEIDQLAIGEITLHKKPLNSGYATPYATYRPATEPRCAAVLPSENTYASAEDIEVATESADTVSGFNVEQSVNQPKTSTCCASPGAFTVGHFVVFIIFCATVVLHVLAWYRPASLDDVVYKTNREDVWDNDVALDYLPSQWIFLMTVAIYSLQLVWFIYGFTIICRNKISAGFLSSSLTGAGYFFLVLSYCSTIGWLFIWDRLDEDRYSAICIAGACVFGLLALGFFARQVEFYDSELTLHAPHDKALIRIWLLNGIGAQSFWSLMLLRYQVAIMVQKYTSVDEEYHFYVYIAIKLLLLLVWFPVDIFGAKRKFSYVFLPYLVAMATSVPLLIQEEPLDDLAFLLTVLLLSFYGLLFIIKIGVSIGRERSSFDTSDVIEEPEEKDLDTFHYGTQPDNLDSY
ncbi:hypothetical protein CAPTEDRAFT_185351 [Capitella teleta]|uniref:Uncharacterized protein n=1 Tax=Capitella teleta TaxID=283909 RepID=R7TGS8_CAPTE|nr:hypothetical protein CAPTEDRAFT_185351 [Capitella teleta]|eukprot:ELT90786.1 hypothetical protein CAPTEDRAFT_185351 [Capitella teleta]